MQLIRGEYNLRPEHRCCVASIGNFDGVHLGHQAVFSALQERSKALGVPTTVIIFEPQPMEYFHVARTPARLTRLREKLAAIERCGIDRVLLLEFGPRLASMEAGEFIENVLVNGLALRHLFVGDDFRFGKDRGGDFSLLQQAGKRHDFQVEDMNTISHKEARISSTRIRQALAQGDFASAKSCLGRPYQICGRVAHGNERGRTIGFPTLNINLHRRVSPLQGVFAVKVNGLEKQALPGVANVGSRPTLDGESQQLLEVHVFDFERQVYGEHVAVEFVERLRDEKKFDSFADLQRQIQLDASRARALFGLHE
jgi:riboflavin kinase/FMN adenylyltransferase